MKKFYIADMFPYLNTATKKTLEAYKDLTVIQAEKELINTPNKKAFEFINTLKENVSAYGAEILIGGEYIKKQDDVITYFNRVNKGADKETTFAIFLDAKNRILGIEAIAEGTITQSLMYPREIIKKALNYGALSVIAIHNHPSTDTNPSQSDIRATKRLYFALKETDMNLLDHIIIAGKEADNNYFSFERAGLISSIQASYRTMIESI